MDGQVRLLRAEFAVNMKNYDESDEHQTARQHSGRAADYPPGVNDFN